MTVPVWTVTIPRRLYRMPPATPTAIRSSATIPMTTLLFRVIPWGRSFLPGNFPRSVILALHQFGHAAAEIGADAIGCHALGLLLRGGGTVFAKGPPIVCDADFAVKLSIAEGGIRHGGDED